MTDHVRKPRVASLPCCLGLTVLIAIWPTSSPTAREEPITVFLAGDTIVMRSFADDVEPGFVELVETMRAADVAVVNLETLFHTFEGFPQADSGGTWMATPPDVAHDLRWAGVDMVSTANNHTFDYGGIGVRENLEAIAAAGLVTAGSGMDLAAARAAASVSTLRGTVSLVSASATFASYGAAGPSTADVHGRPGLNPLGAIINAWSVPAWLADSLAWLARRAGYGDNRFEEPRFELLGQTFVRSERFGTVSRVETSDGEAFLAEVRATRAAVVTIAAVHAHRQGAWLETFAREAVDAGADIVIAHGPHEIRPIEMYRGRPIFYSLGDFFFEQHHIQQLPAEFYLNHEISLAATPREAMTKYFEEKGWLDRPAVWQGLVAVVTFRAGEVDEIRLLPTDLGTDRPLAERGRPRIATSDRAKAIVAEAASLSADYGTTITYDAATGTGLVELKAAPQTSRPLKSVEGAYACLMAERSIWARIGRRWRATRTRRRREGRVGKMLAVMGRARVRPPLSFPGGLNGYPGMSGPDDKHRTRKRCPRS